MEGVRYPDVLMNRDPLLLILDSISIKHLRTLPELLKEGSSYPGALPPVKRVPSPSKKF